MEWYKNGRAPTKRVYNTTSCGSCMKPSIRMVKIGNDLRRVTFWCESCQPFSPLTKIIRLTATRSLTTSTNKNEINAEANNTGGPQSSISRCCPQHGEAATLLRRVRKTDSSNRQRLFYTCKRRGCPYFQWADGHLPKCRCKKKCLMLISKTERTGGRWFLACPNSVCGHFAWATTFQIIKFGPQLTPLR